MPTTKRTSKKPKAVASKSAAPVIVKKKSESHIPTAAVMWIAVLAIVFSFTGISLSAMAKGFPARPAQERPDLKPEIQNIVERLERIEAKVDALKASTTSTN